MEALPSVCVIGAGVSGLTVCEALSDSCADTSSSARAIASWRALAD